MSQATKTETKNLSWLEVVKAFWYFLEKDKTKFIFGFFILLIIFFYDFVPVYVIGKILDFFNTYEVGQSLSPFYFYVIFISTTYIIASLIRLKSKKILNIIGQHSRARARTWGFERLTEFSLEWHNKENTGNKLQRIFTGADGVRSLLKLFSKDLLKIFTNIVGVFFIFLFTDIKFIALILIYGIIFFYIEFTFSKKVFTLSNEFNNLNQSASGTYMESASNMLSIKAMGGENAVTGRVFDKEALSRDIAIKKVTTTNSKWRFLLFIGSSVLSHTITLGTMLVLYSYFNDKFRRSLEEITDLHTEMIELRSDIGQMMPIFKETEFIKTGNESFPKDWDKIEIKNAVMDYGSGQRGLHDFSLILKRNTKMGVAGLSGSGKSTLAKIVLGLYALKEGEFKIGRDGSMKNYYSISHNETLSHITVVLQETELFNLSLRENITMMREGDSELLSMAVEISELKEVIDRLPEGLDAKIGEKGYTLSGGERQRLGIARAIYKNAPIIILDEATSSLDSETEGKIMEKLLGVYGQDKTFLIIAHRLGTLRYTDNIAVMERGKVVEEGSYDQLMDNTSSVFYRMNANKESAAL